MTRPRGKRDDVNQGAFDLIQAATGSVVIPASLRPVIPGFDSTVDPQGAPPEDLTLDPERGESETDPAGHQ